MTQSRNSKANRRVWAVRQYRETIHHARDLFDFASYHKAAAAENRLGSQVYDYHTRQYRYYSDKHDAKVQELMSLEQEIQQLNKELDNPEQFEK